MFIIHITYNILEELKWVLSDTWELNINCTYS